MMERAKHFWILVVALLASVSLLLVASCGGDSDDGSSDDVTGGTIGGESGTTGGGDTGGSSGGTSGNGAMDASVDGAGFGPISTGDVPAEGTCSASIGGMGTMLGTSVSGTCKTSGTACPGGTAGSSDCAKGLVCCIGTDQCDAISASLSGGVIGSFIEGLHCVPQGTCEAPSLGGFQIPSSLFEFQMGCPEGQSCCPMFPEGGFSFEGGFPFEGGMPRRDSGTTTPTDAGTAPSGDAEVTADASAQEN